MKQTHKIINTFFKKKYYHNVKIKPAVFFDRDGVLIKDCHYLKDPSSVQLEDYAFELVKFFSMKGFIIIVVTNQSGISKKLFDWDDYLLVTKKMISLFGEQNPFAGIYANSFANDIFDLNNWRKPSPKMLIEASKDFPIDLKKSIIVGDRISDIEAGARAGLSLAYHTLTGHGQKERKLVKSKINSEGKFEISNYIIDLKLIDSLKDFQLKVPV